MTAVGDGVPARGGIFLGDAVRAVARLRPEEPEDVRAVLSLLGLGDLDLGADRSPAGRGEPMRRVEPVRRPGPARRPLGYDGLLPVPDGLPLGPPESAHQAAAPLPARVTVLDRAPVASPRLPSGTAALPPSAPRPPAHEPLLRPGWARGVLFAAASAFLDGAEVDLPRAVGRIALGTLDRLPRRRRWSTRLGARLLVDFGPGVAPYRADRNWLVTALGQVVGEGLSVLRFAGDPLVVGPGPRSTWAPYRPAATRAPVLVFSDFAAFDPDVPIERWTRFAESVVRAGSRLVLLAPVPPPAQLCRLAVVVPLDRDTTMARARDAVAASMALS